MHSLVASSLWTPRALKPYGWWKASVGISLVSGKVAAWGDQSGNGCHLTQGSDPLRPAYDTSVASRKNKPAVRGTGGGVYLVSSSIVLPRECSVWLVLGSLTTSAYLLAHTGSAEYLYAYGPGTAALYVRNASVGYGRYASPWAQANKSLVGSYDGADIQVYRDNAGVGTTYLGSPITSYSATGTLTLFGAASGASSSAAQVCEAAVFPVLSAAQRAQLHAYYLREYV